MTDTCEELDGLFHTLPQYGSYYQELDALVLYAGRLRDYLLEQGLLCTYSPHYGTRQHIPVSVGKHKVWVVISLGLIVSRDTYSVALTTHPSLQHLVDYLHDTPYRYQQWLLEQERERAVCNYCSPCHYCTVPWIRPLRCGMGQVMGVECTHRQLSHGDRKQ